MLLTISMRSLDQAQNGFHSSNTSLPFTRFTKISQIDSKHLSPALCLRINNYRTSNTHANVSESIGSRAATRSLYLTTTHAKICIRYYKSRACFWTCNEIKGLYDKIIITIVPSYTIPCLLRTRNNTDGNKLVIFFSLLLTPSSIWAFGLTMKKCR